MSEQHTDLLFVTPPELVGTVLGGRYELVGKLGVGGMAAVYEARRVGLHKRFAVKVLKPDLAADPSNVRRFLREARAASIVQHENIVDIVDFGPVDESPVFFVMEFLEGYDLRHVIKRKGAQTWSWSRPILLQIIAALGAAHAKGIVHRDVKPANVFLVTSGRPLGEQLVKMLDFGIAKVVEEAGGLTRGVTKTNGILGTVAYMAPEQAYGHTIDQRTDIYAFGIVWYELLTGAVPFAGKNPFMVLGQHCNERPEPPSRRNPDIPKDVEALILKCLEKQPARRFQTMEELRLAIEAVERGESILPREGEASAPVAVALHAATRPPPDPEPEPDPMSRSSTAVATATYGRPVAVDDGPMDWAAHRAANRGAEATSPGTATSGTSSASSPTIEAAPRRPLGRWIAAAAFAFAAATTMSWLVARQFNRDDETAHAPAGDEPIERAPATHVAPVESPQPADAPPVSAGNVEPPSPAPVEPAVAPPANTDPVPAASERPRNEKRPGSRPRPAPASEPASQPQAPAPATPPKTPAPTVHPDLKNPYAN